MEVPSIYQQILDLKSVHNPSDEQKKLIKELEAEINRKEVIY